MTLVTPVIPDNAFAGQRGITEGTGVEGVGDLASILQSIRSDLSKGDAGFESPVVQGGPVQTIYVETAGGGSDDVDIAIPEGVQVRVRGCKAVHKGAGDTSDTLQLKKVVTGPTVTAITDAMDVSGADKVIVEPATLDDAAWDLDGDNGDILRVSHVDAAGSDAPIIGVFIDIVILA